MDGIAVQDADAGDTMTMVETAVPPPDVRPPNRDGHPAAGGSGGEREQGEVQG